MVLGVVRTLEQESLQQRGRAKSPTLTRREVGTTLEGLKSGTGAPHPGSPRGGAGKDDRPLVEDVPLLVIDDEADYGSVDTRRQRRGADGTIDEKHDPTVINQRIRQLLLYFEKSAYVGYTATPFANIFIHPGNRLPSYGDDLFPRNFITVLPAPSNYVGPAAVFGIQSDPYSGIVESEGLPIIRFVDDADDWMPSRHRMEHVPQYEGRDELPPSLREAIRAFLLACAARRARRHRNVHNSMLVHVTRLVNVQARVKEQIKLDLTNLRQRLQRGDGARSPSVLEELRALWETDFVRTTVTIGDPQCRPIAWEEVSRHLLPAVLAITEVREINGTAGDVLDYIDHRATGLTVIAVGGDKLSRGLTLEGLTVSYFLRTSKMYDTLMQMSRWFGYRPGYLDLCRLYTTPELRDWLRDITYANEELRQEFSHMAAVGGTPLDYGLRVRSHPDLLITAPVKMRQGTELQISFAGDILETIVFHKDATTINNNYRAAKDLLDRLTVGGKGPSPKPTQERPGGREQPFGGLSWTHVTAAEICRFLREYTTHEGARKVESHRLAEYIEKQSRGARQDLTNWTVYVATGDGNEYRGLAGTPVRLVERNWHPNFDPKKSGPQSSYRIRRLLSPTDEEVDIGPDAWERAFAATRADWERNPNPRRRATSPERPSGRRLRWVRPTTDGLLLLYPLEPDESRSECGADGPPIIGFGISFPDNPNDEKVSYVVNPVFVGQEYEDLE
jgi:hypothetical protein